MTLRQRMSTRSTARRTLLGLVGLTVLVLIALSFGTVLFSKSQKSASSADAVKLASLDDGFVAVEQEWSGPEPDELTREMIDELPNIRTVSPGDLDAESILKSYLKKAVREKTITAISASLSGGNEELAWGLAYDLQASVVAYQRTGDVLYLDLFEEGFEAALSVRDDRIKRYDEVRNQTMPGWGTKAYSEGENKWITWDALTGMLLFPAAQYSGEVLKRPQLILRHRKAVRYLAAARQGVGAFESWWREDPIIDEGYYFDPFYMDIAPLNHMNLLGLTHVALCSYFEIDNSCKKARLLARFMTNRYQFKADGSCSWNYWVGALKTENISSVREDIDHAFLNMEFAVYALRTDVAFSPESVKCIADGFADHVINTGTDWGANIDGSGKMVAERKHYGMPLFILLEQFRPGIVVRIDAFIKANPKAYPLGWLSYCAGPKAFAYLLPSGS